MIILRSTNRATMIPYVYKTIIDGLKKNFLFAKYFLSNFCDLKIIEEYLVTVEFLTFSNIISSLVNTALETIYQVEGEKVHSFVISN